MSDEFIRVATKEIMDELSSISDLIKSSTNDTDIENKSIGIEKHLHKIKGLAPMMGKDDVGKISTIVDFLMKKIIDGSKIPNIRTIVVDATILMQKSMSNINCDTKTFIDSMSKQFPEALK